MHIFVAGGTGLVGRHTLPLLLQDGHRITALARSDSSAAKLSALGPQVTVVRGEWTDYDLLTTEASQADAVLFAAFDHADTDFAAQQAIEGQCVDALGKGLKGSGKLCIICHGTASFPTDRQSDERTPMPDGARQQSKDAMKRWAQQGVKMVQLRLGVVVYDSTAEPIIIAALAGLAKKIGHVPYLETGAGRWTTSNADDVGALIRQVVKQPEAFEANQVGAVHPFFDVETNPTAKEIAEWTAKLLDLPAKSIDAKTAEGFGPFLAMFLKCDPKLSNAWTKKTFNWQPKGKSLFEVGEEGRYFQHGETE